MPFNYIDYGQLSRDVLSGLGKLPDIDVVVGVPRSGIIPATMIATALNRPYYDLATFVFLFSPRNGARRLGGSTTSDKITALIVDDSINTGAEFRSVRSRVAAMSSKQVSIKYCAIYGLDDTQHKDVVDYVFAYVPQPRIFQWNYRNHAIAEHALFDLDGVLCVDPTRRQNDDGELYRDFVRTARPLIVPKKRLSGIVTSRLEKYRPETEAWLADHGILYKDLIMLDLPTAHDRRRLKMHARFKSDVYKKRDEFLFIESEWSQAQLIAKATNKPTICTANDILLYGREHAEEVDFENDLDLNSGYPAHQELRRQLANATERLGNLYSPKPLKNLFKNDSKKSPLRRARSIAPILLGNTFAVSPAASAKRTSAVSKARRILMISVSFDPAAGAGAAASSLRLRDALKAAGCEVHTLSNEDFHRKPPRRNLPLSGSTIPYWNSYHDSAHGDELRKRVCAIDPDCIVLGAVDRGIVSLFDIASLDYPIVWVARDNWVHTGGCLFKIDMASENLLPDEYADYWRAMSCARYSIGCVECPAINEPNERAKAQLQFILKKAIYDYRSDIVFAPISHWLTGFLKEAPLTKNHLIESVYNPIDLAKLMPDRSSAAKTRAKYGVSPDCKLVLLAAHDVKNKRKGIQLALDALDRAGAFKDTEFIVMGARWENSPVASYKLNLRFTGFLKDEAEKAALYNCVDATLLPSLQESLSVVASDSLCYGVPVVAFASSGIKELVDHESNGYLATPYDFDELVKNLVRALNHENWQALSDNARSKAEARFNSQANAQQFLRIVDQAIDLHSTRAQPEAEIALLHRFIVLFGGEMAAQSVTSAPKKNKHRGMARILKKLKRAATPGARRPVSAS